jgi:2-amino-4-hydroxy-6-hydroxymethyldihydropteridine diphosphokinase
MLSQHVSVEAHSTAWQSAAVGYPGPDFLNAAVLVRTSLSIKNLQHQVLRQIEKSMGRQRTANKNAPRPIDLDILVIDGKTIDQSLWKEAYLAVPLAELLPNHIEQPNGMALATAAKSLSESTMILRRSDVLSNRSGSHASDYPRI